MDHVLWGVSLPCGMEFESWQVRGVGQWKTVYVTLPNKLVGQMNKMFLS